MRLKENLIPTPLVLPHERSPLKILVPTPPKRFRWLDVSRRLLKLMLKIAIGKFRGGLGPELKGRLVKHELEALGGLWIKVGQFLAFRRDLFDGRFCNEVGKLHDSAASFPGELAKQIIRDECGLSVEELYEEFDDTPIAAASIGQVHRARLRANGCEVAVKVQRPYAVMAFERDMAFIKRVANFCHRFNLLPYFRWREMIWELDGILAEELDYRVEASFLRRMRKSLRPHRVFVPKVYYRVSTQRVLVMEFMGGVFMSDFIHMLQEDPERALLWCAENDVNPERLGRRLYNTLNRMIVVDNLFHADLHPGNIFLLKKSRFALIDFGTVGSLDGEFFKKYYQLQNAIAFKNFEKAADYLLLLAPQVPAVDLAQVRLEMVQVFRTWDTRASTKALPFHEKSFTNTFGELARIMARYQIPVNWNVLRVNRTSSALDGSLAYLAPHLDYMKLARDFWKKYERGDFDRHRKPEQMLADMWLAGRRTVAALKTLREASTMGYEKLLFEGEMLRKRANQFEAQITKASFVGLTVLNIIGFSLLVGLVIALPLFITQKVVHIDYLDQLLQRYHIQAPRYLRAEIWLGILAVLTFAFWKIRGLRKRFQTPDLKIPTTTV